MTGVIQLVLSSWPYWIGANACTASFGPSSESAATAAKTGLFPPNNPSISVRIQTKFVDAAV
jgi:hypothetical protein